MRRKFSLLAIALGLSVAAVALVVASLSVFSSPNARLRYDMSADKTNGVSERVLSAFAGIEQPVKLTAFLYREDNGLTTFNSNVYMRAFDRLRMLIGDLNARVGDGFSSLIVDANSPLVEQQRLQNLHQRQFGEVIVLSTVDNHVVLQFDDLFEVSRAVVEQKQAARLRNERIDAALGDAALRLSNASPFVIGVVRSADDDDTLQPFLDFLERQGHEVDFVESFSELSNQDLAIVAGQKHAFVPNDYSAAERWVADDRHLLLALGAFTSEAVIVQWNQVLAPRGEGFGDGLLCEAIPIAGTLMEGRSECAILEINGAEISGQHDVNLPLIKSKRSLLFAGTRPVKFGNSTNAYGQSRLLRTSTQAWIDRPLAGQRFVRDAEEQPAIHSIAVTSTAWKPQSTTRAGRLMLLGSDEVVRSHLEYNRDWLATSIMYLLGDDLTKSGLRNIDELPFRPDRQILERIKLLTVYLLPGLCLILSLLVWFKRK